MVPATQLMSSYDLDKRSGNHALNSPMYGQGYISQSPAVHPSTALFPEFSNMWAGDSMSNQQYPPPRRWNHQQDSRRQPEAMYSRYPQPFLSECRTTITNMDSPAFQPHILPTENASAMSSMMSQNTARIPRGVGYMDSPSTDSDDLSDHSSPASWDSWSFPYDSARLSADVKRSRSSTSSPDWPAALNVSVPSYDSQWTNIMTGPDSSVTPYTPQQTMLLNGFVFPNRFSPLPESPSPPPMYQDAAAAPGMTVVVKADPHASTGNGLGLDPSGANPVKRCSHCKATSTPLWRRDPSTFKPLCNACGLYLQQRNRLRPQELIDADIDDGNTTDESDHNYVGPECSHCRTHHTSVWRRSKTGAQLCNACGVYLRLRGKPRPLSLKRKKIKPRSKHPKQ